MPSLSDIPIELLEPIAPDAFITWLNKQEIDPPTKRRFVRLWRDTLSANWSKADYRKLDMDHEG